MQHVMQVLYTRKENAERVQKLVVVRHESIISFSYRFRGSMF